jgi:hypothetical protein
MSTPENKVKARLKRRLKEEFGDSVYQFWPVQTGMGASTLDCLLCYEGKFAAIETKQQGKTMTPRQETCRDAMVRAGAAVFCVDDAVSIEGAIETIAAWRCTARRAPAGQGKVGSGEVRRGKGNQEVRK